MKKFFSVFLSLIFALSAVPLCTAVSDDGGYTYNSFKYSVLDDGTAEITRYTGDESAVVIPEQIGSLSVSSIGSRAFYNSGVRRVTVPKTVKSIGWWAFYGSGELYEVNLCCGLKTICYGAFMNCESLDEISIPPTVTKIGDDAFAVSCLTTTGVYDSFSEKVVSTQQYSCETDFELSGYSGTAAQKYADDNSLNFVSLGSITYGDVDGSSKVDNKDVFIVLSCALGKSQLDVVSAAAADVDNDGEITRNDAELISKATQNSDYAAVFPAMEAFYSSPDYFSGGTMYCDGDSVAYGTGTDAMGASLYSYCDYTAEHCNLQMTNCAVSGTTLAKREGYTDNKKSILERVTEMQGDYDVIMLDGGFNDLFFNVDIGSMTELSDKSGNYDEYTTAGALESICSFLTENYPDSIKLFVLGHTCTAWQRQDEYWSLIKKILDKWGISYVDIGEETGLSDEGEKLRNQYFRYDSSKGTGDGVHPLAYTNMKIYGPTVVEKLVELAREKSSLVISKEEITMGLFESCSFGDDDGALGDLSCFKWSSGNDSVATVDTFGTVTATGPGTTVISASSSDGKEACVTVTVKLLAMSLCFDKKNVSLSRGETCVLGVHTQSDEAACVLKFSSSDTRVAEVDARTGKVSAAGRGIALITCRASSGVIAKCTVTVT